MRQVAIERQPMPDLLVLPESSLLRAFLFLIVEDILRLWGVLLCIISKKKVTVRGVCEEDD